MAGIPESCPLSLRELCFSSAQARAFVVEFNDSEADEPNPEDFNLFKKPYIPSRKVIKFNMPAAISCAFQNPEDCVFVNPYKPEGSLHEINNRTS